MTRTIEDRDAQIFDVYLFRLGQRLQIVGGRAIQIDHADAVRAGRDLVHVGVGAMEDAAALGQRDTRNRVGPAHRADERAFERIEGHVDLGPRANADHLAIIKDVDFGLVALADDDFAVHVDGVERLAHRVAGRAVRHPLVTLADEAGGCESGGFGRACNFEGQVAIHLLLPRVSMFGQFASIVPPRLNSVSISR